MAATVAAGGVARRGWLYHRPFKARPAPAAPRVPASTYPAPGRCAGAEPVRAVAVWASAAAQQRLHGTRRPGLAFPIDPSAPEPRAATLIRAATWHAPSWPTR